MHILHVANFSTQKYGSVFYATDRKLSNGFIRNGHFVYEFSDRDIARQENIFGSKKLGRNKLNACLLKALENLQPDLLLLGHTDLIFEKTLDEARRRVPNLRIAQWFVDWLIEKGTDKYLYKRLPHVDAFFCTSAGDQLMPFRAVNNKSYYLPNPIDPSIESLKNDQKDSFDIDLLYCGTDQKDSIRRKFISKIKSQLGDIRLKLHGSQGDSPVYGAKYIEVLSKSKMGLNLSRKNDIPYYSSDRIAQLIGNGLLVFMPETPGFRDLFSEQELIYFNDSDDLIDKIIYYNDNDVRRKEIARQGREKAHTSYNTSRVAQFIMETTLDLPLSENYEWINA
ncbi:glycosyltransferase family protein [Candidatus Vondammii sp. HM_W22]|uniref:glycosyltransferase family protein n=1 Tax=Candidatus Vondammii sp. HM_W22 TaxID=2687299 RepID=UPI001F133414|nr:glycosyltransferase [Candidatus Vondammii sp. HM_W22]